MNDTIVARPNDVILVKVNHSRGFYAYVVDVIADIKPGWWQVKMCPLIVTPNFKLTEMVWKLDDSQIRGAEFTMSGLPHQLCEVNLPHIENKNEELTNDNIPICKKFPPYLRLIKGGKK